MNYHSAFSEMGFTPDQIQIAQQIQKQNPELEVLEILLKIQKDQESPMKMNRERQQTINQLNESQRQLGEPVGLKNVNNSMENVTSLLFQQFVADLLPQPLFLREDNEI